MRAHAGAARCGTRRPRSPRGGAPSRRWARAARRGPTVAAAAAPDRSAPAGRWPSRPAAGTPSSRARRCQAAGGRCTAARALGPGPTRAANSGMGAGSGRLRGGSPLEMGPDWRTTGPGSGTAATFRSLAAEFGARGASAVLLRDAAKLPANT